MPSPGTLVKDNFVFTGWNTQADGQGTTYTYGVPFDLGSSNITLYAKWSDYATAYTQLAEVLAQQYYLDDLLSSIYGITMKDTLNLPDYGTEYYQKLMEYARTEMQRTSQEILQSSNSSALFSITVQRASLPSKGDADNYENRLKHAYGDAISNMLIDSNHRGISKEATYMFMSHYIDMPAEHAGSSANHNCNDGYYSKWITNEDRNVYDTYINQQRKIEYGFDLANGISSAIGLADGLYGLHQGFAEGIGAIEQNARVYPNFAGSLLNGTGLLSSIERAISVCGPDAPPEMVMHFLYDQYQLEDYPQADTQFAISNFLFIASLPLGLPGVLSIISINAAYLSYVLPRFKDFLDLTNWTAMIATARGRSALRFYRMMGM